MARQGARTARAEPQPPQGLPPESRPVGQLIAETIKLYGRRFWPVLALGVPLALRDQLAFGHSIAFDTLLLWAASPVLAVTFAAACALAAGARPSRRAWLIAVAVGVAVFFPFPALRVFYVVPGVAWLALVGWAVPAALLEGRGFRAALRRGAELGRADYIHALGGLAALVVVYGVASNALVVLLRTQSDQAARGALLLADLVISPIVFLGSGLLYFDQAARVVHSTGPRRRRSRDADLPAAVQPDAAGRADAEIEPRPAAPGQQ
jgi:hypothetical protein